MPIDLRDPWAKPSKMTTYNQAGAKLQNTKKTLIDTTFSAGSLADHVNSIKNALPKPSKATQQDLHAHITSGKTAFPKPSKATQKSLADHVNSVKNAFPKLGKCKPYQCSIFVSGFGSPRRGLLLLIRSRVFSNPVKKNCPKNNKIWPGTRSFTTEKQGSTPEKRFRSPPKMHFRSHPQQPNLSGST